MESSTFYMRTQLPSEHRETSMIVVRDKWLRTSGAVCLGCSMPWMQYQVFVRISLLKHLSLVFILIESLSTKYKNNMESAIALQVYPFQVSGKEPKLLSQDKSKVLKGFNQTELDFYEAVFHPNCPHPCQTLRPFLPAFHGKLQLDTAPSLQIEKESENEWLSHLASRYKERNISNAFIVLQNLTNNYSKPCVFDIKIGGRNVEGKKHKITKSVSSHCLRLNGCRIAEVEGQHMMLSKYFLAQVVELDDITNYLAFFLAKGDSLQQEALRAFSTQLRQILAVFEGLRGQRFISSSICLIYDGASPGRAEVRLIDFGRLTKEDLEFKDSQSERGIGNILQILVSISSAVQKYEEMLPSIRRKCLQSKVMHIPEHKRSKPTSSASL